MVVKLPSREAEAAAQQLDTLNLARREVAELRTAQESDRRYAQGLANELRAERAACIQQSSEVTELRRQNASLTALERLEAVIYSPKKKF